MEMSKIYNGSQWAHDIFLVNKAGVVFENVPHENQSGTVSNRQMPI